MANEQNLLKGDDIHKFTHEEQSRGGKKRAENIRKRKAIAETLNILMAQKVKEEKSRQKLKEIGIKAEDQDMQMLLLVSEFNRALGGNSNSRDFIMKMLGETSNNDLNDKVPDSGVIIVDDCEFVDDEEDIIEEEPIE